VDAADPVIQSVQKALANGQAVAALQLLADHRDVNKPGQICVLRAQALLAIGRTSEALACIGLPDQTAWARWPERWRTSAAAVLGEAYALEGKYDVARQWLARALTKPGLEVVVDRLLLLYAETLVQCGENSQAERVAHALWRDWPRSPYRARAGLLEARLLAEQQPAQARMILAGVRSLDALDPQTHLAAAELLCKLLLDKQPAQCLAVADQTISAIGAIGSLPIWRVLAIVQLDAQAGMHAIESLPDEQRQSPTVQAVFRQLQQARTNAALSDSARSLTRAQTAIDLGQPQEAAVLLMPLAQQNAAALILLASIPRQPLNDYIDSSAIRDPLAAQAVGIALAQRGDLIKAWPLLQRAITGDLTRFTLTQQASLWYWCAQAAEPHDPQQAAKMQQRLLALPGVGLELGLAWCAEAQRRERQGLEAEQIRTAWERAAITLPTNHPWHPSATWRAVKLYLDVDQSETRERALSLLLPASAVGDSEDHRRCRFYLAQLYERQQKPQEARQLLDSLRVGASPEQTERLDRLAARLRLAISLEVESDPLDAEN
jgi:tetratricopeptide (TPR) repeat protein